MPRSFADARRWMQQGTTLLGKEAELDDEALSVPSALPGWSRTHLLAHLAANADALGNLVRWAATGQPTPMYASPGERAAGIERGSRLPARRLPGRAVRRRDREARRGSRAGPGAGGHRPGGRWELPGHGETVTLAGITAYLTGRAHHLTSACGDAAPALPAWL
jgi:Mycothiol maleylpyruvate isomerase N-terminal domain